MSRNEMCFVCRRVDSLDNLGAWLVGDELRAVHLECWLASYDPRGAQRDSRDVDPRRPWPPDSEQAS
jgi:hypothetical protein